MSKSPKVAKKEDLSELKSDKLSKAEELLGESAAQPRDAGALCERCWQLRRGPCRHGGLARQAALRQRWHRQLFETADGIQRVIASVKRFCRRANTPQRAELKEHIRYMQKQKARARYAHLRQQGIPIGSGITEGACKSLVGMRAKRSGQRWSQRGLTAALHLRSIVQSDRFESFWPLFAQRYRATSITPIASHRA